MSLNKDPGQEAIAYCASKYSQMVDDVDYFEDQRRQYVEWAMNDCTEAVDQTDENVNAKTLVEIGNRARWLSNNGDLDEQISYIDEVCRLMYKLINAYAEAAACLDMERRMEHGDMP